ncbi:hypothetical protein [Streptomyces sp. JH34]|uniref:hypothetical protein n=1 Tax=unclassified Streptomyces TaxID=2593676 RepID=UPI0023FA0644|nr:hypothetical protein [Streptomyces sp. JH34]MDF6023103.1 hypothetical protein [Streptomyces sp. JH34]
MNKWLKCRSVESGSWEHREGIQARISELRALLNDREEAHREEEEPERGRKEKLFEEAHAELNKAEDAISPNHSSRYKNAAHVIVGRIHIDAAHNILLRLSKDSEVLPLLPGVLAFLREHLLPDDPRRIEAERIAKEASEEKPPSDVKREILLEAMGVARQARVDEAMRVRSFVYIVWWIMLGLTALAVLIAILGFVSPGTVPLCFTPEELNESAKVAVCPVEMNRIPETANPAEARELVAGAAEGADYLIIELVGLLAASIAAAAALRRMRGTSTPFAVPLTLALLKLPTGALTAVLGILLMRGGFVPGLTNLDSSAQIIAWAVVFGYAQQIFTHFVDNQAQSILAVGGPGAAPPAPSTSALDFGDGQS